MKQMNMIVEGMSCGHCVNAVANALTALSGIAEVSVDLPLKTVTVDFDEDMVTLEMMKKAIEEEGYEVV